MPVKDSNPSDLPAGFSYQQAFLTIEEEEEELLRRFKRLEFQPFDFHGYIARRRIVEYGFEYDFASRGTSVAVDSRFLETVTDESRCVGWRPAG